MARYQDPYAPTAPQGGVDRTAYSAPVQTQAPRPQMPMPRAPTYPTTPQAQYGQGGYQTPQFPGFRPTQEFAQDPTTANYESLMNYQIPYFMQPVQQTNYLQQSAPQYGQLLDTIQSILGQTTGGPSAGESMLLSLAGSLAGGGNADAYAGEYRDYLNKEPYTGAEWEAYRTEALDPIEADRTTAINRALREISDQGIDPSSGIAQAKLREVNAAYDANRAGAQNQLAIASNQTRAQRKGQAFEAGLSAEQLKTQAKSAAMSGASGAANAWNNRMGLSADLAGMGNTAALQRAQMGYGVDANLRGEQNANFQAAMQLAQIMSQLPSQRQAEALQLMSGNDPSSVLQGTSMVGNQRTNQQHVTNQSNANTWGGLGSLLGYFGQAYPQGGGTTGYTGGTGGGAGGTASLPGNIWPGYSAGGGFPGWSTLQPSQSYAGYMTGLPR